MSLSLGSVSSCPQHGSSNCIILEVLSAYFILPFLSKNTYGFTSILGMFSIMTMHVRRGLEGGRRREVRVKGGERGKGVGGREREK